MSEKRKNTNKNKTLAKKKKLSSKHLSAYFKSYKNGLDDIHLSLFREVNKIVQPVSVLYPGCYRHITASLIFEDVLYIDCDSKVKPCFEDKVVLNWVNENKEYSNNSKIKFLCKNFMSDFGEKVESFDLALSLCAGIVTTSCSKYVNQGGFFLVCDAHFDARKLILDDSFELKYVWDGESKQFTDDLDGHFITTDGDRITKDMVEESMKKPKARRSFKLQKEALFYLFRKK